MKEDLKHLILLTFAFFSSLHMACSVCEEYETRCNGSIVQVCTDGKWENYVDCGFFGAKCSGGTCVAPTGSRMEEEKGGEGESGTEGYIQGYVEYQCYCYIPMKGTTKEGTYRVTCDEWKADKWKDWCEEWCDVNCGYYGTDNAYREKCGSSGYKMRCK